MKRICVAISSNDKDTTMHLEIYAPEYKGDLKGLIQICHGMTEYMGRYVEFAKYFTSRGYIVFGNDIISHGHSTAPHQDHPVCTLMTGTTQLKIWYQQGNMLSGNTQTCLSIFWDFLWVPSL